MVGKLKLTRTEIIFKRNHHTLDKSTRESNSAIHKAAGSLATGRFQKASGWNHPKRVFQPAAPIHSLWDIFQWNGGTVELYQLNYGTAGNREAGSFVNSAVTYFIIFILLNIFLYRNPSYSLILTFQRCTLML